MIRTALVGLGQWGRIWARVLARLPEIHLRYFCDLDKATLGRIKERFGYVNLTPDLAAVLRDAAVDLVAIAAPTSSHYELVRQALERGKHVFVEQPLARSAAEARELVDLAAARGRLLFVGQVDEFNPGIRRLKDLVAGGELGRTLYAYSQRLNLGGSVAGSNPIWEFAAHDVYVLRRVLGRRCLGVTSRGFSARDQAQPQVVFAALDFEDNLLAHLHLSWLDPGKVRKLTLVGENKMVRFDDLSTEAKLTIFDRQAGLELWGETMDDFGESQLITRTGDVIIPCLPAREPLMEEARSLIGCLKEGGPAPVPLETAVEVVAILEAAQASLDNESRTVAPASSRAS